VYVFRASEIGWVGVQKLTAPGIENFDSLGEALSVSGPRLLVGAPGTGGLLPGAAHVYREEAAGWVHEARLEASDGVALDQFGRVLALDGDRALVGAPLADQVAPGTSCNSGAAYVFERTPRGWTEVARLLSPQSACGVEFGRAVALSGDVLAVGAWKDSDIEVGGRVYIFEPEDDDWVVTATLAPPDPAPNDLFGGALAFDGTTLLIGAEGEDDAGSTAGATYVFERGPTGWVQVDRWAASDASPGAGFGFALAVDGERALVSAPWDDGIAPNAGKAFLFERSGGTWRESASLVPLDGAEGDSAGWSVALDGPRIALGTPNDDDTAISSGSATLVSLDAQTCPPLFAVPAVLDAGPGGTQFFALQAGSSLAGTVYLMLGSLSGTEPGVPIGHLVLPLVPDALFTFELAHPNAVVLNGFGLLNGSGQASARLSVADDATLPGKTLHHAYVALDPLGGEVLFASNAVPLTFVP
jgi:hypothetical protein